MPFSPPLRMWNHQQSLRREKPSAPRSIRQALRQIIALLMPISPPCLYGCNGFLQICLSRDGELISTHHLHYGQADALFTDFMPHLLIKVSSKLFQGLQRPFALRMLRNFA